MAIKAFEVYGDVILKDNGAAKKLDAFGKKAQQVGKNLSTFVTLPILGIGAAMVKVASDAEETNSKFDAVFKNQSASVREWAKVFSDNVGRSTTANLGFLATIQDTLVPLGFMRDRAADMSKQVIELATDLGSFNNLPTADVVRDIQSAIVGNTETLRKYGVVASQDAIIQEALTSGLIKNKNELDATSKAQAIYNILLKGTVDAQGDAERTSDSTANQMKKLKAEVEDLAIEFGQQLLPIVKDIIGVLSDAIKWFSELDEGQKKMILTLAGIAAAAGPVIGAIGGIGRALSLISAHPILLISAALVGYLGLLTQAVRGNKELYEANVKLHKAQEIEATYLSDLVTEYQNLQAQEELSAEQKIRQAELAEELHKILPDLTTDQINDGKSLNAATRERAQYNKELALSAKATYEARRAIAQAEVERDLSGYKKSYQEQVDLFGELEESFDEFVMRVAPAFNTVKDQVAGLDEQIELADKTIADADKVLQTFTVNLEDYGEKTERAAKKGTEALKEQGEELDELAEKQRQLEEEKTVAYKTALQEQLDEFRRVDALKLKALEDSLLHQEQLEIEAAQRAKERIEEEVALQEYLAAETIKLKQSIFDAIFKLTQMEQDERIRAVTDSVESEVITEEEGAKKIEEIKKQYAKKEWELKGLALLADSAIAIGKAVASAPWPANLPAIGFAAAAMGLQTAAWAKAKPYATGGIVPGDPGKGDVVPAMLTGGEMVLNAGQQAALFRNLNQQAVSYQTTNNYTTRSEDVNVYVSDEKLFSIVQRGLDNQKIIPGRRTL